MAFIDKLSKIAKSVGDEAVNAAKKSGDLIEITKLNHSISNEEDNIKAEYTDLGILVYRKFQSGVSVEEDFVAGCNRIDELNKNIETLKQKIREVKNVKSCQSCGNQLALEVMFCPKCGTKQSPVETPHGAELKTCPSCAAQVADDSAFCTTCGAEI